MYRLKEIQDALLHVVGWEQSFDPAKAIDTYLTQTESGLYFQGAHPLLTLACLADKPDLDKLYVKYYLAYLHENGKNRKGK